MKKTLLIKALAAVLVLIGCIVALPVNAEVNRMVKVHSSNGLVVATYDPKAIEYFEFSEGERSYPYAEFAADNKDNIVFHLTPAVSFKMIKVQGGSYALQDARNLTTEQKTKTLSDYYIAEFECTQALWKYIKGSVPSGQSATGDDMPVAMVSCNDIMGSGSNTFLKLLNAKMPQIKANSYSDVVEALGYREFRLPNEWEWEYAAAGGSKWSSLKYTFSGSTGTTAKDLEEVAVNSVSTNPPSLVAKVGTKLPNNLGLYDMSGNVYEWCSGLGYLGYESTPGYMYEDGSWYTNFRPIRGGSWNCPFISFFLVMYRNDPGGKVPDYIGFRLAL